MDTPVDTPVEIPALADAEELSCDVLVIGGGTAGTMAALTAAEHGADVLLLEKAHVRHSGALAMGMDGVNNAVIPGRAEPDDYVAEITRANDGIVDQSTVRQTATRGFAMVRRLESYGVKFEKDEHGEYAVRQVHRSGSYVLPMPEGKDVKKVLYRQLRRREMRERIRIENRVMPVRVLTAEGRAVGAAGFNTRTGRFVSVRAGAVILATGACGRLGLPASGYLYGTYENPTNAGDGYAMAYHAGAELTGIECFQINPLIKDYNGPACAYVANPFGGYQVNRHGERFVDSDYWSGQMMAEFAAEIASTGARCTSSSATSPRSRSAPSSPFCTPPNAPRAVPSTPVAATTTAPMTSRCTSPRSACAAATPLRAYGSTTTPVRPCPVCTPPGTWPVSPTTT